MSSSAVVAVSGVTTSVTGAGQRRILFEGVDLVVEPGESVAVMGRSGSGKSTLLRVIAGIVTPESGRVVLAGHDLTGMSESDRARVRGTTIGMVFQDFRLIEHLSARENIALAGVLQGMSRSASLARADQLADTLGISAVAGSRPARLSGGEQQRTALARALMNDPAVILADEPTGSLDSRTADAAMDLLLAGADEGRSVIVVTHDSAAAERAGRLLDLDAGALTPRR